MTKSLLLIVAAILLTFSAMAQHCPQDSVAIPPVPGSQTGLTPLPADLPCMVVGQQVDDTIYFHNFSTFYFGSTAVTVDSLKIDSISNLPAGLCWISNKPDNNFAGGEDGIIYVHGICTGAPGQYKLRILIEAQTNFVNLPPNTDAEPLADERYYLRVRCPAAACPPLDTVAGLTQSYIAYPACPAPPVATISPAGPVHLCPADTILLIAYRDTGYTYRWSTGATTDTIRVSAAGSYTVTVFNAFDSTTSAPTVVAVVTAPSGGIYPSGSVDICSGDTATFSAVDVGVHYRWSNGDTAQSDHIGTAGSYTLTVTDIYQCSAVSAAVTVVVHQLPAAIIIPSGHTLTAGTGSGYRYQWFRDGVLLHDTTSTLTADTAGSYTLVVTNPHLCSDTSAAVREYNVGIHDIYALPAISLYPNPGENILTLETSGRSSDLYEVYDELGRAVKKGTVTADKMPVDMSGQQPGIYYLAIRHDQVLEAIRFTIIR